MITLKMIEKAVRSNFVLAEHVGKEPEFPFETVDVYDNGDGTSSDCEISKVVARTMIVGLSAICDIHKDDVIEFLSCEEDQYLQYLSNFMAKRSRAGYKKIKINLRGDEKWVKIQQSPSEAIFNNKYVLCSNHLHMQEHGTVYRKSSGDSNLIIH